MLSASVAAAIGDCPQNEPAGGSPPAGATGSPPNDADPVENGIVRHIAACADSFMTSPSWPVTPAAARWKVWRKRR